MASRGSQSRTSPFALKPRASDSTAAQPRASVSTTTQQEAAQPREYETTAPQPSTSQASESQPNASQPTQKLLVIIDNEGEVVGPNAAKFSTQVGVYLRAKIPIFFPTWKAVDQTFKDAVWDLLTAEFDFNIPAALARIYIQKKWPSRWRVIKSRYRTKILRECGSIEEAIGKCPKAVDPNHWVDFIMRESDPDVQALNDRNAENRKKNPLNHGLGRQSYAQKLYRMDEENPEEKHGRVDVWLKGHERPDGSIIKSAEEKYRQVKLAHERKKSERSTEEDSEYFEDYNSDAIAEVFGQEKRTRTRGVSSHLSKKQLEHSAIGKILFQQAGSSQSKIEDQLKGMQTEITSLTDLVKTLVQNGSKNQPAYVVPSPVMTTPQHEVGSSSVQRPQHNGQNLMNLFDSVNHDSRSSSNPKVTLLDTNQNEVATGYVVTNSTICHGRTIFPGEKKVWVEKVLNGDTPIYDGPQDGAKCLADIVDGAFVVWLEGRLRY